ncbi:helix-turn-helix transcriptional regulator [Nocardioides sp. WV_118_6]
MQQISRREQIAANTRAAKARRQATDADIAQALDITRPGVSDRMNGKARWQIEELEKLAAFLGTTLDELLAPAETEAVS